MVHFGSSVSGGRSLSIPCSVAGFNRGFVSVIKWGRIVL